MLTQGCVVPDFSNRISFRVLPGCCLLCGQRSYRPRDICHRCEQDLPWLKSACARCGGPVPVRAAVCGNCVKRPPVQDRTRAPFRYAWPLDAIIQRFKFNDDQAAGRMLGELFAQDLLAKNPLAECVLPVPLHPRRLRERGFNQSVMLAASVASALGLPVRDDIVERVRETAPQTGMTAIARRRNVRGAFALRDGAVPAHVAILDDVVTTGSTTAEIARLLRRAGARTVEVWALARAL